MTVPEKLRMARKLVDLGVDILEAGFPIASDGDFERGCGQPGVPVVQVAALARCCTLDWSARRRRRLKHARRPRIHTFIATSHIHLKYKLKKTEDQVLEDAVAAVELARRHVDDVEFSAEDGGPHEPRVSGEDFEGGSRSRRQDGEYSGHGGLFSAGGVWRADRRIVKALGDCAVVSVHCHDDLGWRSRTSLAECRRGRGRSSAASTSGARRKCSLEEVVMVMKTRNDCIRLHTGIHTEHIIRSEPRC